jgi:hypothetical protein
MPTYTVQIRGVKFRPREAREIANNLTPNETVRLEAEPDNPYDPCAIQVIAQGEFIGYVQKDMAKVLHPYTYEPMTAYVSEMKDMEGRHYIEVVI